MSEPASMPGVLPKPIASVIATAYVPLGNEQEDHPFFHLIGRVCAEWAQYENILTQIICDLTRDPRVPLPVKERKNIEGLFGTIIKLLKECACNTSLITECESLRCRTEISKDARNRIVHDSWFLEPVTGTTPHQQKRTSEHEWIYDLHPIEENHIRQTVEEIRELHGKAYALRRAILSEITQSNCTERDIA